MESGSGQMNSSPKWIFRFERLINPSAFSLFFAEGRCLFGITAGAQVVIREFETEKDAQDSVMMLLGEIEKQDEHGNNHSENSNPAA